MLPLSEVSLYAATREQTIVSWKRTAVEWGTGLTLEEYIDRELVGEKQEFARDGKNVTWVLAPRSDPTTLDFLCSCETFKRNIAISRSTNPGEEPVVKQGFGYGIASVFTPPQNRGNGYGKHMMRLLHWVLAREEYLSTQVFPQEWGVRPPKALQAGDGSVSALWSDVGPNFYVGCGMGVGVERGDGWLIKNPFSTVWNVHDTDILEDKEGSEVTWLDEESAKVVWEKDTALIKSEVKEAAKSSGKARTQFSFLPNEGVAEFQWYRLHYYFSRYVPNPPRYWGVSQNGDGFATWTCEYRPGMHKTLIVTRLRASEDAIEELMARVLRYAKDIGLDAVETWNLAPHLERSLGRFKGARVERDEHYPAIKWYGDESVEWLVNERFCWC